MKMRILSLLAVGFCCLLLPSRSLSLPCSNTSYSGGWRCVQQNSFFQNSGSGVTTVNVGMSSLGAHHLIIGFWFECGSVTCTGAHDTHGNMSDAVNGNYTCPVSNDNVAVGAFSGMGSGACYFCNTTSGAINVAMTFSNASFPRVYVIEVSNDNGNIASSCLDQTSISTLTSGTSASPAIASTASTTANDDFVYSFITTIDGNTTAATGGFTALGQANAVAAEIEDGATQTTYTTGWTITPGGAGQGDFMGGLLTFLNPVQASNATQIGSFIVMKGTHAGHGWPWRMRKIPWDRPRKLILEIKKI